MGMYCWHCDLQLQSRRNGAETVSVDAESKSSADAASVRPASLSTSHDVTIESWLVSCSLTEWCYSMATVFSSWTRSLFKSQLVHLLRRSFSRPVFMTKAGNRMSNRPGFCCSKRWLMLRWWQIRTLTRAKLKSHHHCQNTNTQFLQAGFPSCRPPTVSKEWKHYFIQK